MSDCPNCVSKETDDYWVLRPTFIGGKMACRAVHVSSNSGTEVFTSFEQAKDFMNSHKHLSHWHCDSPKKEYHKPKVTRLGSIRSLTLNSGTVNQTDNPIHNVGKRGAV